MKDPKKFSKKSKHNKHNSFNLIYRLIRQNNSHVVRQIHVAENHAKEGPTRGANPDYLILLGTREVGYSWQQLTWH